MIILLILFRHLLSDQTDPFNRSPLTMDMVKSNIELQHRVQEWIQQKKQEKTRNCHWSKNKKVGKLKYMI